MGFHITRSTKERLFESDIGKHKLPKKQISCAFHSAVFGYDFHEIFYFTF